MEQFIKITRVAESNFSRSGADVNSILQLNQEKVFAVVSGLMEKAIAKHCTKMEIGDCVSLNLELMLSDLAVSAAGRVTRETLQDYFGSRKEEIAAIFAASKGISAEKLASLPDSSLEKLFAMTAALIERVAISCTARDSAVNSVTAASVADLDVILQLENLPELFAAKVAAAKEKQDILFDL